MTYKNMGVVKGEKKSISYFINGFILSIILWIILSLPANASQQYDAGMYKIGDDMEPGEYVLIADSDTRAYFCISSDSNQDDIIDNDNFNYDSIITVETSQYLEMKRCYAIPFGEEGALDVTGPGMFRVGIHISQGEYKLIADEGSRGYYCVYSDSASRNIIANKNFEGSAYVSVEDGQYLELKRCHIENPVSLQNNDSQNETDEVIANIDQTEKQDGFFTGSGSKYENGTFSFDKYEAGDLFNDLVEEYGYYIEAIDATDEEGELLYRAYNSDNDEYNEILVCFMEDSIYGLVNHIEIDVFDSADETDRGYFLSVADILAGGASDIDYDLSIWQEVLEAPNNEVEKDGLKYYCWEKGSTRWCIEIL